MHDYLCLFSPLGKLAGSKLAGRAIYFTDVFSLFSPLGKISGRAIYFLARSKLAGRAIYFTDVFSLFFFIFF